MASEPVAAERSYQSVRTSRESDRRGLIVASISVEHHRKAQEEGKFQQPKVVSHRARGQLATVMTDERTASLVFIATESGNVQMLEQVRTVLVVGRVCDVQADLVPHPG
ncbi:MAG: hypothetical protein J4F97_06075, partial [Pseudomonadales bacterium]|nr:hypothetical protein [Pseudomonadales bacterium]